MFSDSGEWMRPVDSSAGRTALCVLRTDVPFVNKTEECCSLMDNLVQCGTEVVVISLASTFMEEQRKKAGFKPPYEVNSKDRRMALM